MLKLDDYKTLFIIVGFVGSLVIASPLLTYVIPSRASEAFSKLYLLGPSGTAEGYPSNVVANETYRVYVGISDHMGSSAYYALQVKLRDRSEPLPNDTTGTPSPLPTLYEYHVFLGDNQTVETPVSFSFGGLSFLGNSCRVDTVTINGLELVLNKDVSWNSEKRTYSLELFFELWIFSTESTSFSYHNRFVGFWLNMTS
jgi:uncharacterized membrane protein